MAFGLFNCDCVAVQSCFAAFKSPSGVQSASRVQWPAACSIATASPFKAATQRSKPCGRSKRFARSMAFGLFNRDCVAV
jgi:hypothetical protein